MALFTHLKIILLQYFQFLVINRIQIDSMYNLKYKFSISLFVFHLIFTY